MQIFLNKFLKKNTNTLNNNILYINNNLLFAQYAALITEFTVGMRLNLRSQQQLFCQL